MRRLRALGASCALAAMVLAVVLGTRWALPSPSLAREGPTDEPAGTYTAINRQTDLPLVASASVVWEPGRPIYLGRLDGVVTALHVAAGSPVPCGEVVAGVDARRVRSFCATAPLWRPIAPGVAGPDVAELARFLTSLGYFDGETTDVATGRLGDAIVRYNADHSFGPGPEFAPEAVVWLPGPEGVAEVAVAVGELIGPGTRLMTTRSQVIAARVEVAPGPFRDRFLLPGGATVSVARDGSLEDLSLVEREALSGPASLPSSVVGTLRLAEPMDVVTVRSSSLVAGSDGRTCVYVRADVGDVAHAVEVLDVDAGVAYVATDLAPGAEVIAAPKEQGC